MTLFFAILLGALIIAIGIGTLRGFAQPSPAHSPADAEPVRLEITRITFSCESCGTEVLLLRRGSDASPRHCGEAMTRRDEVSRN